MIKRIAKPVLLLLIPGLLGLYVTLNYGKLLSAGHEMKLIQEGEPSAVWALGLDGMALISRALPPTGVFDSTAHHQINVEAIPERIYERIQAHTDHVTQVYNLEAQTSRLVDSGKFLATQIADRRVYLVREGDTESTASIFWDERRRARDVIECLDPAICSTIRFDLSGGWGQPMGPYLKSDISPARQGMPRGRWMGGPVTQFKILSARPQELMLDVMILRLTSDQDFRIKGDVDGQKLVFQRAATEFGNQSLYPTQYRVRVRLAAGANPFEIVSSKWRANDSNPKVGLAGYVVKMKVFRGE
ncbi:MAG: hypothetical protein GC138_06230 [Gammaproteobacteria bacterium]|nr:hypothetical protein [Gammaproteobacteria bacterium]